MPTTRAFEPMRRRLILTAFFLSVGFAAAPLPAEESATAPASKPGAAAPGDQKMRLNEVEIHGDLEKPKIFFILPKAKRDSEARQRQFRFYPDILEPLDKDRFEEEARVLYQNGIPAE
jgi:hypothetical protein